jgi:hypothetical protein
MRMVCVCVGASQVLVTYINSRSRESGHVGAAAGLTRRALRRSEGASAVGYRYGYAEQPLGAASST